MEVRSALGLYNKQGCGYVAEKLALITKPMAIVNEYLESHPTRSNHVREGKVAKHVMSWTNTIDLVEMNVSERLKAQWAHSDKSVYYTFYMYVIINKLTPAFGSVKAVLYEAIYATSLTTFQLGWKQGVEYAVSKKYNGKNFIVNWTDGLRDNHGHMGHGQYPRSMNSRWYKQYLV